MFYVDQWEKYTIRFFGERNSTETIVLKEFFMSLLYGYSFM